MDLIKYTIMNLLEEQNKFPFPSQQNGMCLSIKLLRKAVNPSLVKIKCVSWKLREKVLFSSLQSISHFEKLVKTEVLRILSAMRI